MEEKFMMQAYKEAQKAFEEDEVPVGCVVTVGLGEEARIVGRGKNLRESAKNAVAHAEISAIDEACRVLGGWRLWQCDLYVTLEPCIMCSGAISGLFAYVVHLIQGLFYELYHFKAAVNLLLRELNLAFTPAADDAGKVVEAVAN